MGAGTCNCHSLFPFLSFIWTQRQYIVNPLPPLPSYILHLPRLAGPLHVPPPRACSHTCPRSTFPPPSKARLQQEIGGGDVVDEITGNCWLGRSWELLELLIPPASSFCSSAVSPPPRSAPTLPNLSSIHLAYLTFLAPSSCPIPSRPVTCLPLPLPLPHTHTHKPYLPCLGAYFFFALPQRPFLHPYKNFPLASSTHFLSFPLKPPPTFHIFSHLHPSFPFPIPQVQTSKT
ncbi:hypothetical protein LZ31DRAFT_98907 [Colletotrichum somersetense]|nr:hypothetical protein LZ31DRAFT_98907 [Colletotrichum somersetense]